MSLSRVLTCYVSTCGVGTAREGGNGQVGVTDESHSHSSALLLDLPKMPSTLDHYM